MLFLNILFNICLITYLTFAYRIEQRNTDEIQKPIAMTTETSDFTDNTSISYNFTTTQGEYTTTDVGFIRSKLNVIIGALIAFCVGAPLVATCIALACIYGSDKYKITEYHCCCFTCAKKGSDRARQVHHHHHTECSHAERRSTIFLSPQNIESSLPPSHSVYTSQHTFDNNDESACKQECTFEGNEDFENKAIIANEKEKEEKENEAGISNEGKEEDKTGQGQANQADGYWNHASNETFCHDTDSITIELDEFN